MKKILAILLALVLALTTLTIFAEEDDLMTGEVYEMSGFVLEIADESILILADDGMTVQVNLTADTLIDAESLAVGDHLRLTYNGMMTRSMPAQITADSIGSFKMTGIVSDMAEEGFLLTVGEQAFQVNATAEQMANIQDGMEVTVFYNGMMTRSMPAQITASHIRGQAITGSVVEMTQEGFTLYVEENDVVYTVIPMENALSFVTAEPGMTLTVITNGLMTMSLEPIVNAVELLPAPAVMELFDLSGVITEIADEYILMQGTDGQEYQVNVSEETLYEGKELSIGDLIHVTFNGQMTFSLPAQVFALKIGCYAFQGVVSEISDEQFVLTTENDVLLVNINAEAAAQLQDGATVLVYSNGAMTMSLPAQIAAELIVHLSR